MYLQTMKKYLLIAALVLAPSLTFAATPNVTVRATLIQQLLTQFVAEVNGIQQMQDTIATAVDPTQFLSLSALLQNQFTDTQNQLDNLLNPSGVPEQTAQNTEPLSGATPMCVSNPTLNVSPIINNRGYLQVQIDYRDICKIDPATPYSITAYQSGISNASSNPNSLKISTGTLGKPDQFAESGDPWMDGDASMEWFEFEFGSGQMLATNLPIMIVTTVGELTSTTTIQ